MKKSILLMAASLMSAALFAQKTIHDANAEKRNVSGFHAISVSGGIDLYLSPGAESVAVSASEQRFADKIKTEVEDGVLKIWYESSRNGISMDFGNHKLKAYVSFSRLDKLIASGGSDVSVEGTIKSPSLELRFSGGSDFEGSVDANDLQVVNSGGSDVKISGKATSCTIDANGGSDFKGYDLLTEVCKVEASGGSDIYISASREINAQASGGSDVFYKGEASIKELRSSGSSSVKKVSR